MVKILCAMQARFDARHNTVGRGFDSLAQVSVLCKLVIKSVSHKLFISINSSKARRSVFMRLEHLLESQNSSF